jgi:hypothetical protein
MLITSWPGGGLARSRTGALGGVHQLGLGSPHRHKAFVMVGIQEMS